MELNFYSLSVLYLVYSFLGWVGETVVATIKGRPSSVLPSAYPLRLR